jgi:hypothetical protein
MTMDDYTFKFILAAHQHTEFSNAVPIVRQNSQGRIWLVGGFVYRSIANKLYDVPMLHVDLDFVVEEPRAVLQLPMGWVEGRNKFDHPRLANGTQSIDIIPLKSIIAGRGRKLEPTIESYFASVPLTIQAIGYDFDRVEVIGDTGKRALETRTVGINDPEQAAISARNKSKSVDDLVRASAAGLNFRPVLPG